MKKLNNFAKKTKMHVLISNVFSLAIIALTFQSSFSLVLNRQILSQWYPKFETSTSLDLRNKTIDSIAIETFSNLTSLEQLALSSNRLVSLDSLLFKSVTNVWDLRLDNNLLTNLDDSLLFQSLVNLEWLNLESNQLVTLDVSLFSNLKNLKIL